jgi:hypothetical protein
MAASRARAEAGRCVVVIVSSMVGLYELYLALPPLTGAEEPSVVIRISGFTALRVICCRVA